MHITIEIPVMMGYPCYLVTKNSTCPTCRSFIEYGKYIVEGVDLDLKVKEYIISEDDPYSAKEAFLFADEEDYDSFPCTHIFASFEDAQKFADKLNGNKVDP